MIFYINNFKMKKFKFLVIATIAMFANCVLSSCSGDDKDSPDNPEKGKTTISEVTIVDEYGMVFFSNFRFDNDKRIISYELKNTEDPDVYRYNYTYTSSTIRVDNENGDVIAFYNVENGLIVSGRDYWNHTWEYEYDEQKHIVTVKKQYSGDAPDTYTCVWKDGNLISYKTVNSSGSFNHTITYTDQVNSLHIFPVDILDGYLDCDDGIFDAVLCSEGYFGNMPANLPLIITDDDSIYGTKYEFSYSGYNKHGYPSKMIVNCSQIDYDSWGYTYNFSWSE